MVEALFNCYKRFVFAGGKKHMAEVTLSDMVDAEDTLHSRAYNF